MRCNHCGKCCEETEMELSESDIGRLEKSGYIREEFTVKGEDNVIRLENVAGKCYFYDSVKRRCRVYAKRPEGCYTYPVVYLVNERIIIDPLCPMGGTISEGELKRKGRILIKILKKIEKEEKRRILKRS